MAGFDYKKEYKDLYLPKPTPVLIDVPKMNFVCVRGSGNPNDPNGEYTSAVGVLYAISYTIKMSKMGENKIEGYFDYVVPPLEGFWWMAGGSAGVDYSHKENFVWMSLIRLPEFVDKNVFAWAKEEAARKKKIDTTKAEFLAVEEGLCVQCLHTGTFDEEPVSVAKIEAFINGNGLLNDIADKRHHHEIYLNDPRKTAPEKNKCVLRVPVKKKG